MMRKLRLGSSNPFRSPMTAGCSSKVLLMTTLPVPAATASSMQPQSKTSMSWSQPPGAAVVGDEPKSSSNLPTERRRCSSGGACCVGKSSMAGGGGLFRPTTTLRMWKCSQCGKESSLLKAMEFHVKKKCVGAEILKMGDSAPAAAAAVSKPSSSAAPAAPGATLKKPVVTSSPPAATSAPKPAAPTMVADPTTEEGQTTSKSRNELPQPESSKDERAEAPLSAQVEEERIHPAEATESTTELEQQQVQQIHNNEEGSIAEVVEEEEPADDEDLQMVNQVGEREGFDDVARAGAEADAAEAVEEDAVGDNFSKSLNEVDEGDKEGEIYSEEPSQVQNARRNEEPKTKTMREEQATAKPNKTLRSSSPSVPVAALKRQEPLAVQPPRFNLDMAPFASEEHEIAIHSVCVNQITLVGKVGGDIVEGWVFEEPCVQFTVTTDFEEAKKYEPKQDSHVVRVFGAEMVEMVRSLKACSGGGGGFGEGATVLVNGRLRLVPQYMRPEGSKQQQGGRQKSQVGQYHHFPCVYLKAGASSITVLSPASSVGGSTSEKRVTA